LKPLTTIWKGGSVYNPVMIQNQKNVINIHHRFLPRRKIEVVHSLKVFIDVLSPVSQDSFLRQKNTNIVDIRSDLRVQASAHTPPVEHTPNPPIFVERTFLSHVVLI
jgi:hypothetical protein